MHQLINQEFRSKIRALISSTFLMQIFWCGRRPLVEEIFINLLDMKNLLNPTA